MDGAPHTNLRLSAILMIQVEKPAKRHTFGNINSKEISSIFQENLAVLESIINWCKTRNINVILITLPAYESYYSHLNDDQLKTTLNTINKIIANNNNCYYLNMLVDPRFTSDDFYDADHLSEIGRKKALWVYWG